jgi:hypothetical protein
MKGKKSDPSFISFFISECVQAGLETPDEIVARAKKKIAEIDEEIKAVEVAKKTRSKLLDVISSFQKPVKDKTEEAKLLPFFDLKYPDLCKSICERVKTMTEIDRDQETFDNNTNFIIKQLLECQVLSRKIERSADCIFQGPRFDEYMKFVLHEDK